PSRRDRCRRCRGRRRGRSRSRSRLGAAWAAGQDPGARRRAQRRQSQRQRHEAPRGDSVRVVIADDSVLLREGIARVLADDGFDVVSGAGTADELLDCVARWRPDVAIVDIRMPPTHSDEGLVAAETIRKQWPDVGVLVLSQYVETDYALRLLEGGEERCGYLLK